MATFLTVLEQPRPNTGAPAEEYDDSKISSPPHSIAVKILVNYLQMAAIVQGVSLAWPAAVESYLNAAESVSNGVSTMVSMDCNLSDAYIPISVQTAVIKIATPLIIWSFSIPVWLGLWVRYKRINEATDQEFKPYMRNRMTITSISIIFFFYSDITEQLLSFFSCPVLDANGSGVPYGENALAVGSWWSDDYNLKCYERAHLVLVVALGVPGVLLFCIGVPVGSALFLYHNRHLLHTKPFLSAYGFLYGDYGDGYFWWESVIMARKFVIVVVVVFLTNVGVDMQLLVALGAIIAAMIAHMMCAPFRLFRLGLLERFSLYGSVFIVYIALYFVINSSTRHVKEAMSLILVVSNSILVGILAFHVGKEWLWGFMKEMDQDEDGLLSCDDIDKYKDKISKDGKKLEKLTGMAVVWLLQKLANTVYIRGLAINYLLMYPCELFNPLRQIQDTGGPQVLPPDWPSLPPGQVDSDDLIRAHPPSGAITPSPPSTASALMKGLGSGSNKVAPAREDSWQASDRGLTSRGSGGQAVPSVAGSGPASRVGSALGKPRSEAQL